jgi:hypothetical protein
MYRGLKTGRFKTFRFKPSGHESYDSRRTWRRVGLKFENSSSIYIDSRVPTNWSRSGPFFFSISEKNNLIALAHGPHDLHTTLLSIYDMWVNKWQSTRYISSILTILLGGVLITYIWELINSEWILACSLIYCCKHVVNSAKSKIFTCF